ncbi:hypothetical protein GLYMA_08G019733v4 [Glycine max]|nr:hypothetical protein GLYMA_08G019733v4 [Glycine max]KAH1049191.1 hypothetical protein GYH30_019974 [Glycine max]
MGNCSGGGGIGSTTYSDDHPRRNGITVLPPNSNLSAPPATSSLGRRMEDMRSIYIFGRELGRGQFGVTYLVTHKATKEQFACKSIATRKLVNRDDIDDIRREVQIMHHLTGHRNIVELKGAYEDRHSVNLVMELCAGGELFDRIITKSHYSERAAANSCRQIVTVVHNCHSMGVMHRDLTRISCCSTITMIHPSRPRILVSPSFLSQVSYLSMFGFKFEMICAHFNPNLTDKSKSKVFILG